MENKDFSEFLIRKIKTDYDYWQGYIQRFEDKIKTREEEKKELIKQLMDNPDSTEPKEKITDAQIENYFHSEDLHQLVQNLLTTYKLADRLELTDSFPEELNKKMQNIKDEERKQMFVVEQDKLTERVKGSVDKRVKEIKESEQYKQALESVTKSVQGK